MCFSNPDGHGWHHVNNRERNISSPPSFSLFSLSSPSPHSLALTVFFLLSLRSFIFQHSFVFIQISQFLPQLFLSVRAADCDPPFSFFLWGGRESCNHREVACKGSDWAQLYTTVWWSLLPICICKSLRILFVCLFEPGQVCWMRAKAKIKTSNPISYYTYCCYNGLLWSIFSTWFQSLVCIGTRVLTKFRGPRAHENLSKQMCYIQWSQKAAAATLLLDELIRLISFVFTVLTERLLAAEMTRSAPMNVFIFNQ